MRSWSAAARWTSASLPLSALFMTVAVNSARYLYICEDGLVHYCSQQRGYPGKPLAEYTTDDIRREYLTEKSCAPHCTVSCVHQIATVDFWRDPQTIRQSPRAAAAQPLIKIETGPQ